MVARKSKNIEVGAWHTYKLLTDILDFPRCKVGWHIDSAAWIYFEIAHRRVSLEVGPKEGQANVNWNERDIP